MKAPLSWLKDYVDINCSVEELTSKLFSCGFEVEEIINVGKNIERIVTCKVISIDQHPNADKLSVVMVDAGTFGTLQIVTSAKNLFVGAVVPVALDGSTLSNGEKIVSGELRGVTSYGMFCSGEELGINDDWYEGASVNGILILDQNFPLGKEVKELLEIEDTIFDINVTANRPDCQSILGLAREVAAVLNKPLKMPDLSFETDKNISTIKTVKVTDLAYDLCPRYISHLVKDIKLEQSPRWLKRRLASMGLRSINNIVDITNFVLLEIGQPMHAFDLKDLSGNQIVIRRAKENEEITTLDKKSFTLSKNNLVICDTDKPVALAGIMGGLNSEIKPDTVDVLFESATFKRDNIRKSSRLLGQRSDSSARYEKGVDLYSVETGMKRALNLICKLNCGKIACDEYDLYQNKPKEKVITTTITKVNAVLGIEVPKEVIKDILTRLTFKVEISGDNLSVTVPLYREDLESYPDIAEEIIREYGYEFITPTLLKTSQITSGGLTERQKKLAELKALLSGYGYNEIITYSFVPEKDFNVFDIDKTNTIKILNPISEDLAVMRKSLIPSAVRVASHNINRKNYDGKLFEVAKTYFTDQFPLKDLPEERQTVSLVVFGEEQSFFTLKGAVQGIFDNFCYGKGVRYIVCQRKFMHPTRSAEIMVDGVNLGYLGQVSPEVLEQFDVDKPVYVAEIYYDLLEKAFTDKIVFKSISKFPQVERDLAILLDKNITCQQVVDVIKDSAGQLLDSIKLFDVYTGDRIANDKKSMAFNLIYQSSERTLNVEEIDLSVKNIVENLNKQLNAELRQ